MLSLVQSSMNGRFAQFSYQGGNQRHGSGGGSRSAKATHDAVELSPNVPEPFTSADMAQARDVANAVAAGQELTTPMMDRLRMDRVFYALATLQGMNANQAAAVMQVPGIPSPTKEELAAAYKKLSQHVRPTGGASDTIMTARLQRIDLIEAYRSADFAAIAEELQPLATAQ